ncbi:MAG: hypothetical protein JXQ29_02170 [Planctomycetes bacterium]|nr:hypothetical protein [Planctomycetota bacterium]
MRRIVMLMPHFGRWPEWIDIYLETCRHNPTVDWIFFTDCGRPANRPANVRFVAMDFAAFLERAARRLALDLPGHTVRKLCDFRPMFGVIFAEHLEGYDHFGFGDVDVVYGNLRKFLTAPLLDDHDVLSFHTGMLSGHFALLRNCAPVKDLFRRLPAWRAQLADRRHLRVDEDAFSTVLHAVRTRYTEAFSTPSLYRRWQDGSWNFPTAWYWRDGAVTNGRDGGEHLYFHFLFWKGDTNRRGWQHRDPARRIVHGRWDQAPLGWRIDAAGFHPLREWPEVWTTWQRWSRRVRERLTFERARFRLKVWERLLPGRASRCPPGEAAGADPAVVQGRAR